MAARPVVTTTTHKSSRTIKLQSGGTVTVEVSGNVLELSEDDWTFLAQVVERLDEYEDRTTTTTPKRIEKR